MATTDEWKAAMLSETTLTRKAIEALVLHLGAGRKAEAGTAATPVAGRIATAAEIDDPEWGDKEIRKDPKRWKGGSYTGKRWSEVPPEFLDVLQSAMDYKAGKQREEASGKSGDEAATLIKYAGYAADDAAKVRAHAKRKREQPAEQL